jgi:ribokinase
LARGDELGKRVILNPAPAMGPLPPEWFAWVDYLTPNESEAQALTAVAVSDLDSARRAGDRLRQLGADKVIITLGAQGALLVSQEGHQHFPAPQVQPLDTTAAGDTFIGGFAAGLVGGLEEGEAIAFGQRAAALSVTRVGAQPSIPYLAELMP